MQRKRTKERNELLFQRYVEVLKSHGKYASRIAKGEIYEEVGRPFFLDKKTVSIIICRDMLKCKRHIFEDDDDLRWMLSELDKIAMKSQ